MLWRRIQPDMGVYGCSSRPSSEQCTQFGEGGGLIEEPQRHKTVGSEQTDPPALDLTLQRRIQPGMGDNHVYFTQTCI